MITIIPVHFVDNKTYNLNSFDPIQCDDIESELYFLKEINIEYILFIFILRKVNDQFCGFT